MKKLKAIIRLIFLLTEATIGCLRFILLSNYEILAINWESKKIRETRRKERVKYLEDLYKKS